MPLVFSEVIKIYDLDAFDISHQGAESLKFRLEVLRRSDTEAYYARIYRRETFRVQATFPQIGAKPARNNYGDHEIFILDDFIGAEDFKSSSTEEVLEKVKRAINKLFPK